MATPQRGGRFTNRIQSGIVAEGGVKGRNYTSSLNLIRWCGVAALAGGAVYVLQGIVMLAAPQKDPFVSSSDYLIVQLPLEERELRERFGVPYHRYCELVPRFVPNRKPVRRRDLRTGAGDAIATVGGKGNRGEEPER